MDIVRFAPNELAVGQADERALCSHVSNHSEADCVMCCYSLGGSIAESDESMYDLERRNVFQIAHSLWQQCHSTMNTYLLARQISEKMHECLDAVGIKEHWVDQISTEVVWQHFVYHLRSRTSIGVLVDHEIGNACALLRQTERATLVRVTKRARVAEEDEAVEERGVSALQAGRCGDADGAEGVTVVVNEAGLRAHLAASASAREWIKLRLKIYDKE